MSARITLVVCAAGSGGKQGPALTKHIIEANQQLTQKERDWHAEQEKTKGNEHFRWGGALLDGGTSGLNEQSHWLFRWDGALP